MLTYEQFVHLYNDLKGTNVAYVQSILDEAALEIDPAAWGTKTNLGHGLLAAYKLSQRPYGKNAQMDANVTSRYQRQYEKLVKQVFGKKRPLL